jgi:hypothetical protein
MMKLAAKLLLFAAIFFIYDKIFLIVANLSAENECDKRLEYVIKSEINKDIIIAGSSRGARDVIAGRIEDRTGLSTYNLCYPGSNVEFHSFILRTLVKFNKSPRIVLLVVDDNSEFKLKEKVAFRKDRLYPLVKYSYIRQELIDIGIKDKYLSKFFVLHQLNMYNFDLRKKRFSSLDTIKNCGSMPISWQRKNRDWNYVSGDRIYLEDNEIIEKINAYKEIIETCKSNDIVLVVVFPPNFQTHSKSFENRIRQLSGTDVIYYIYDNKNPIYTDKNYFYDEEHLKLNGAIVFTDELINFLNKLKCQLDKTSRVITGISSDK